MEPPMRKHSRYNQLGGRFAANSLKFYKRAQRFRFDDVKRDLIATGLVEDKAVLDEEGKLVSEVCFKLDSQRRIINMDETHHNLSITEGVKLPLESEL
jgi:hypothetical protein